MMKRILLVDDNDSNLKLITFLLEGPDREIRTASDARQMDEVLKEFRPDLILLDIQLPDVDGIELARRLRATPSTRYTPIIAVTAYAMKGDDAKALAAGVDAYVTKPIDKAPFRELVNTYLERVGTDGEQAGGQSFGSPRELVEHYDRIQVADHPFFRRLRTNPVDLGGLWLLMANLREGICRRFVPWLAMTIARLDNLHISSLLAQQLYDELGKGNPDDVHRVLLDRFVAGLEPWRVGVEQDDVLRAGRHLHVAGNVPFEAANCYEAVGALMVGEVFAKQMDLCLGSEMRRQTVVAGDTLEWLVVHERLEVAHADDSSAIARYVPDDPDCLRALWRGGRHQWSCLWDFLTDVAELHDRAWCTDR